MRVSVLVACVALAALSAVGSLRDFAAEGHGMMLVPVSRNVYHGVGPKFPSSSAMGASGDTANLNAGIGGGPEGQLKEYSVGHGLCGDDSSLKRFSVNGPYATSPIQATVNAGSTLDIKVRITAYHYGWFEFRLCTDAGALTQECLNQHVLELDETYSLAQYSSGDMPRGLLNTLDYIGSDTTDYGHKHTLCDKIPGAPSGSCCRNGGTCSSPAANRHRWMLPAPGVDGGEYTVRVKIPSGVSCDHCVLQWMYQTANSIDHYPEAFWNCADIKVVGDNGGAPTTHAPVPAPTAPTTSAPTTFTAHPTPPTTTFQGTGSCTGLPCSSADMCRSQWGSCGVGPSYCNDNSVWTLACGYPSERGLCTGDPCPELAQCRSKWGYCGTSAAYCNAESLFTPACLDPNFPTTPPSPSLRHPTTAPVKAVQPTPPPSSPVASPVAAPVGTGTGCTGEPCQTPSHCRSKWGHCGIGDAWCNAESTWKFAGCGGGSSPSTPAPTPDCSATPFDRAFSANEVGDALRIRLDLPKALADAVSFEFVAGDQWRVEGNVQDTAGYELTSSYETGSATLSLSLSPVLENGISPTSDFSAASSRVTKATQLVTLTATGASTLVASSLCSSARCQAAWAVGAAAFLSSSGLFVSGVHAATPCGSMTVGVTVPSDSAWGNVEGISETRTAVDALVTRIEFQAPGIAPTASAPTTRAPTAPKPTHAPTTRQPTSSPVVPPPVAPVAHGAAFEEFFATLSATRAEIDAKILLYQTPQLQWTRSSVYNAADMIAGLRVMAEHGVNSLKFYVGEDKNDAKYGLVNLAAFLAQARKEAIQYDACDENSWDLVNGKYPLSNACGQLGQSYEDYDGAYACPKDPTMQITATTNAKWYGAPGPLFCAPKSVTGPTTGVWDYTYHCNNPWKSPPEVCGTLPFPVVFAWLCSMTSSSPLRTLNHTHAHMQMDAHTDAYPGQQAGRYDSTVVGVNRAGRSDVEGCCWWGRGVIQSTGRGNYGALNYFLGARAAREGRVSMYPDVDFCVTPNAICDSVEHPELKWIAGLFYWLQSVQNFDSSGFNYIAELKAFVDGGFSGTSFIDKVSGIVNRGCPALSCPAGSVDGAAERASNFRETLHALGLISR